MFTPESLSKEGMDIFWNDAIPLKLKVTMLCSCPQIVDGVLASWLMPLTNQIVSAPYMDWVVQVLAGYIVLCSHSISLHPGM